MRAILKARQPSGQQLKDVMGVLARKPQLNGTGPAYARDTLGTAFTARRVACNI